MNSVSTNCSWSYVNRNHISRGPTVNLSKVILSQCAVKLNWTHITSSHTLPHSSGFYIVNHFDIHVEKKDKDLFIGIFFHVPTRSGNSRHWSDDFDTSAHDSLI